MMVDGMHYNDECNCKSCKMITESNKKIMENKELYNQKINGKVTDVILSENCVIFLFENDKITIRDTHNQDCCEDVYADWSIIEYHKPQIIGKDFCNLIIKAVDRMGFIIDLVPRYLSGGVGEKIFIPCYNVQSGYYRDDLTLIINDKIEIDVSNLTVEGFK